jgi:pyrimidine-nucleoside phosphorylase
MVETGERMGKQMAALITDMSQPLGHMVGNALEVQECIEVLHGGGPEDLRELCLHLAAWMFFLGAASKSVAEGKLLSEQIIASGKAFERLRQMVELQGGDISVIDDPTRLPGAEHRVEVRSLKGGYVASIDCENVGTVCVILGGGRVAPGEPLCTIHCRSDAQAARAKTLLEESYQISNTPPAHKTSLVHRAIYKRDH